MNLRTAIGTTKHTKYTNNKQLAPGTLLTSQVTMIICCFVSFVYFVV